MLYHVLDHFQRFFWRGQECFDTGLFLVLSEGFQFLLFYLVLVVFVVLCFTPLELIFGYIYFDILVLYNALSCSGVLSGF